MSKMLFAALSLLIFIGSVSVPSNEASACGSGGCYTTTFTGGLVNP